MKATIHYVSGKVTTMEGPAVDTIRERFQHDILKSSSILNIIEKDRTTTINMRNVDYIEFTGVRNP